MNVEDGDRYPPKFLGVLIGSPWTARDETTWGTRRASRAVENRD